MFLNREAMRVVERNDRGNVTYRRRYKFGDEVDLDHIDDAQVENLKSSGALVESEDDLTGRQGPTGPYPGSQVTGAATGEGGEGPEHNDDADADGDTTLDVADEDPDNSGGAPVTTGDGDDVTMVDEYEGMDYSELQAAAKAKDLKYVGVSAEDLRASLRA